MSWLIFAFAAPMLWAASTHVDKYLVDRFTPRGSVAVLLIFTSLMVLPLVPAIWLLRPQAFTLPWQSMALIAAVGVLYMGAMLFYLEALQTEEASSVAPWFQATPLFGYALGYGLLGETLPPRQMLGGALIVAGAVLLSLDTAVGRVRLRLVLLMLACALTLSLSAAIFKLFALRDEFWTTTAWTGVGQVMFGLLLLIRAPVRRQLRDIVRASSSTILAMNGANEVISLIGSLAQRYALLLAPLSLVQAIGGTGPLFVYLFGIALSLAFPVFGKEDLSAGNMVRKASAMLLIVAGVTLISR